jgi:hypothetical protein
MYVCMYVYILIYVYTHINIRIYMYIYTSHLQIRHHSQAVTIRLKLFVPPLQQNLILHMYIYKYITHVHI